MNNRMTTNPTPHAPFPTLSISDFLPASSLPTMMILLFLTMIPRSNLTTHPTVKIQPTIPIGPLRCHDALRSSAFDRCCPSGARASMHHQ